MWSGIPLNDIKSHQENLHFLSSFILYQTLSSLVTGVVILIYQFVISPCFYNYIPSMLKGIGLGLLFALFTTIYYVLIFGCKEQFHLDTTSYKAMITPEILIGISYALIFSTSMDFIIAQSPHQMRGLMVGLWYAANDLGYVIDILMEGIHLYVKETVCQDIYYYVMKSTVIVIILILFVILAK